MTLYIIINFRKDKDPEKVIFPRTEKDIEFNVEDGKSRIIYICDVCFKSFKMRNLAHLEKCRMNWPYQGASLCKFGPKSGIRIYRIEKEDNYTNKRIIKALTRLGVISKYEQKIDFPITVKGLLGKRYKGFFNNSRYFYYVVFSYKRIVAYALIQVHQSIFSNKINIVIRDLYTFPPLRKGGYATLLLNEIRRQYYKKSNELIFSRPISEKLKELLRSRGLRSILTIQGEKFDTISQEEL